MSKDKHDDDKRNLTPEEKLAERRKLAEERGEKKKFFCSWKADTPIQYPQAVVTASSEEKAREAFFAASRVAGSAHAPLVVELAGENKDLADGADLSAMVNAFDGTVQLPDGTVTKFDGEVIKSPTPAPVE